MQRNIHGGFLSPNKYVNVENAHRMDLNLNVITCRLQM